MDYYDPFIIQKYLSRFDVILFEMANKMFLQKMMDNITINFIKCMIPHHQAAIYMCQNLLNYRIDPRLKKVAENIIREQSLEIKKLEEIRRNLVNKNNLNDY